MGFERADHGVLWAEVSGLLACRYSGGLFLTANPQSQTVPLDRLKVSATRNGADVIAGERKLDCEVTADGSGTVDTNLHVILIFGHEDNTVFAFGGSAVKSLRLGVTAQNLPSRKSIYFAGRRGAGRGPDRLTR
jgi:hypothetical protein